jgi:phosphoglycolate phosphatase-like HAD superfamily hydrolase
MAVIFDLDQTLIDSSAAEALRKERKWNQVYDLIPILNPYEEIHEIIALLSRHNIPIAIVTSSPQPYCERVITQWGWNINAKVCWHCTKNHKPSPDPILLALKRLNLVTHENVVSIGDHSKDIHASKAAKVFSIGCTWGLLDSKELLESAPDLIVNAPAELRLFLINKFHLQLTN